MTRKQYLTATFFLGIIGIALTIELIRDPFRDGDFVGYVNAGNLLLSGQDIYSDYLNTWPPFFSVFSVPLALMDRCSPYFVRLLWTAGSIAAMYYVVQLTVQLALQRKVQWRAGEGAVLWQDPLVLVPLLIVLRFVLDNLANVQINMYLLLLACLTLHYFVRGRFVLTGLLLGFSISLKIFPVFLLFYFLFKREWKPAAWTILFVVIFNLLPVLVFGPEQAKEYYLHWYREIASVPQPVHHKNQSVFGFFSRLFTSAYPGTDYRINVLDLSLETAKRLAYASILLVAVIPAWLFRKKLAGTTGTKALLEYSFILTVIPLLSPVAWKAYFVFLWFPYFLTYALLFRQAVKAAQPQYLLKTLFWLSVVLNVLSTEGIAGGHFSDVLETWSCVAVGTLLLLGVQLRLYCMPVEVQEVQIVEAPVKG